MSRFLLAATAVLLQLTVTHQDSNDLFDNVFHDNLASNNTVSIDNIRCTGVEGSADNCIACFNCDHPKIKRQPSAFIITLKLKDKECKTTDICCFRNELFVPRENEACGAENPEGRPRSRRPSLKAVLDRQYPWRAWVYSIQTGESQLLCAATYIHMGVRALVTTATCVSGQSPSSLVVKFSKRESSVHQISRLVVHKDFVASTRKNDIAILTLANKPDDLVSPVCNTLQAAKFATSCIAVSDTETYINEVIPQQKSCNLTDNSAMCVFSGSKGIKPQEGAGLYCLEQGQIPRYLLHGIYLNDNTITVGSKYTNTTFFYQWIKDESDKLKDSSVKGYRQ